MTRGVVLLHSMARPILLVANVRWAIRWCSLLARPLEPGHSPCQSLRRSACRCEVALGALATTLKRTDADTEVRSDLCVVVLLDAGSPDDRRAGPGNRAAVDC